MNYVYIIPLPYFITTNYVVLLYDNQISTNINYN